MASLGQIGRISVSKVASLKHELRRLDRKTSKAARLGQIRRSSASASAALPDELLFHAERVASFFDKAKGNVVVLSGAGLSTGSGIPDYRGENGIYKSNVAFKPITFQEFSAKHSFRQRYWARSYYGYPRMLLSEPNGAHRALAKLHENGFIHSHGLVTQNVDGLQQRAGTPQKAVVELHGSLKHVGCLHCREKMPRDWVQEQLSEMNPAWKDGVPLPSSTETLMGAQEVNDGNKPVRDQGTGRVNPDGDLDLVRDFSSYQYPDCPHCRTGILKPSVVFFGENIPSETKDFVAKVVTEADGLLVVGTSLATYSALRIVKQAVAEHKPVVMLNKGDTRGDEMVDFKLEDNLGQLLPAVAGMLVS